MQRRIALHRKYYTQSLDPVIMEIIMSREHLIRLEMGFLNATHDLQTDIAKLTSRIDDLRIETKLVSNLYFYKVSS